VPSPPKYKAKPNETQSESLVEGISKIVISMKSDWKNIFAGGPLLSGRVGKALGKYYVKSIDRQSEPDGL
jgi:hypothetical protein